jgi:hypothetical protein
LDVVENTRAVLAAPALGDDWFAQPGKSTHVFLMIAPIFIAAEPGKVEKAL